MTKTTLKQAAVATRDSLAEIARASEKRLQAQAVLTAAAHQRFKAERGIAADGWTGWEDIDVSLVPRWIPGL